MKPAVMAMVRAAPAVVDALRSSPAARSAETLDVVAMARALNTYDEKLKTTLVGPSAASCSVPAYWIPAVVPLTCCKLGMRAAA